MHSQKWVNRWMLVSLFAVPIVGLCLLFWAIITEHYHAIFWMAVTVGVLEIAAFVRTNFGRLPQAVE